MHLLTSSIIIVFLLEFTNSTYDGNSTIMSLNTVFFMLSQYQLTWFALVIKVGSFQPLFWRIEENKEEKMY